MIEFLTTWHSSFFEVERIPVAVGAVLVAAVIGMITGPLVGTGNANPFVWVVYDKLFGGIGDRLDKRQRPRGDLIFRGFLMAVFGVLVAALLGKGLSGQQGWVFEMLALTLFLSCGAVWFALLRLYFAMEKGQVDAKLDGGAYFAIARSARANFSQADDYTITRVAMNFAARSFDKAIVAPVLWYLIAGLLGVALYAAVAALAWRFGKDGFTAGFGAVPLALEKLMGFVPGLLSGVLIVLAALATPTARPRIPYKNIAAYEQGGAPLSALAWALDVSLGGAYQDVAGSAVKGAWVGPEEATAQNSHKHLRRAIYMTVIAHLMFLASLGGMYVWGSVLIS